MHLTTQYCYVERYIVHTAAVGGIKFERNYERNIKREKRVLKTGDRIASAGPDETGIIC